MLSVVTLFAALWLIVGLAPDTPIGRACTTWLVVRPATWLSRITAGHVLLTLMLVTFAATIGWAIGHESVRLMAMALPDVAAWVTMFEVTAYLDAIAALVTAASVTRIGAVKTWIRSVLPRRTAGRARRAPRRTVRAPANDNEADGGARRAA